MLTLPDFNAKKVILFFSKEGDRISFKNDNLIIKDAENKVKCQYTCYKIFLLIIVGGFDLTSGLIERANRFGFSIVFMNYNFKVYATINSKMEGNTLLREKQYTIVNTDEIGKRIIINKIENQRLSLQRIRKKDDEMKGTIKLLIDYENNLEKNKKNTAEIMGIEGIASKVYFRQMFKDFNWNGRQPRVKRDHINLLLDIGYTVLFNYIEAIVNIYGFDIYKGILHKEFFKRKSLICDIIEPFRTIIDYKIRKMHNLSQINENDFIVENGKYRLEWRNSSKYMNCFIEEIVNYKEWIFNYVQSYYRWFMKGADIEKMPAVYLEDV